MSPRRISELLRREAPVLSAESTLGSAIRELLDSDLPALPVVDADERYFGIFGEREFIAALFPAYLGNLSSAAFLPAGLERVIEKRHGCLTETIGEHANTEHVEVPPTFSDVQIAETFLHHRVLIVPVVDDGSVHGVITRDAFVRVLVERLLSPDDSEQ
jgi:CBS domain-containing protein